MMTPTAAVTETKAKDSPTYISYTTFITFLDWVKEMKVTPSQLDRTLWGPKFAGSTGVQLMSGLRFLGLTTGSDNNPTPALDKLARADKEGRDAQMRELLKQAYGADFVDSLPAATPMIVNERLEALGATTSTHRKAVSFFVNAAKTCGIHVPTAISKKSRIKGPRLAKAPKPAQPNASGDETQGDKSQKRSPKPETNGGSSTTQSVVLQGATLVLSVTITDVIKFVTSDDPKWLQDLMVTVNERRQAPSKA